MRTQRWHCRPCDKTAFPSQRRAEAALAQAHADNTDGHKVPVRAYPCPYGNGHHLTSHAYREAAS